MEERKRRTAGSHVPRTLRRVRSRNSLWRRRHTPELGGRPDARPCPVRTPPVSEGALDAKARVSAGNARPGGSRPPAHRMRARGRPAGTLRSSAGREDPAVAVGGRRHPSRPADRATGRRPREPGRPGVRTGGQRVPGRRTGARRPRRSLDRRGPGDALGGDRRVAPDRHGSRRPEESRRRSGARTGDRLRRKPPRAARDRPGVAPAAGRQDSRALRRVGARRVRSQGPRHRPEQRAALSARRRRRTDRDGLPGRPGRLRGGHRLGDRASRAGAFGGGGTGRTPRDRSPVHARRRTGDPVRDHGGRRTGRHVRRVPALAGGSGRHGLRPERRRDRRPARTESLRGPHRHGRRNARDGRHPRGDRVHRGAVLRPRCVRGDRSGRPRTGDAGPDDRDVDLLAPQPGPRRHRVDLAPRAPPDQRLRGERDVDLRRGQSVRDHHRGGRRRHVHDPLLLGRADRRHLQPGEPAPLHLRRRPEAHLRDRPGLRRRVRDGGRCRLLLLDERLRKRGPGGRHLRLHPGRAVHRRRGERRDLPGRAGRERPVRRRRSDGGRPGVQLRHGSVRAPRPGGDRVRLRLRSHLCRRKAPDDRVPLHGRR